MVIVRQRVIQYFVFGTTSTAPCPSLPLATDRARQRQVGLRAACAPTGKACETVPAH